MQSLGHIAGDQDFRVADFVTAKNLWRSNCAHLMPVARVVIEQNFHTQRLVLHDVRLRAATILRFT